MAEAGPGKIRLFEDFFSVYDTSDIAANTTTPDTVAIGPFSLFGEGLIEIDAGLLHLNALSGAVRMTTTNVGDDGTFLGTTNAFDVTLMAPIVLEARVQFNNLDTKRAFIGFTDAEGGSGKKDLSVEDDIVAAVTTTFTPVASDYVGFYLSAELTDDEDWHALFRGGTASQSTDTQLADFNIDAVAGEWQVLRLEIDPNGTVRWYIDGSLERTEANAVSTSVDLGLVVGVEAQGNNIEEMDIDYLLVTANRDWTV